MPTTRGFRDAIASHLGDKTDRIIDDLAQAGWEIIESKEYEDLLVVRNAALAVAGAELNGSGQEGAWGEFENVLEGIYGMEWLSAAHMALYGLRGRPL